MANLKYDTQIEVTKPQYDVLKVAMAGIIAHREDNGKYYIKVWYPSHSDEINQIIKTN